MSGSRLVSGDSAVNLQDKVPALMKPQFQVREMLLHSTNVYCVPALCQGTDQIRKPKPPALSEITLML